MILILLGGAIIKAGTGATSTAINYPRDDATILQNAGFTNLLVSKTWSNGTAFFYNITRAGKDFTREIKSNTPAVQKADMKLYLDKSLAMLKQKINEDASTTANAEQVIVVTGR